MKEEIKLAELIAKNPSFEAWDKAQANWSELTSEERLRVATPAIEFATNFKKAFPEFFKKE